MALGDRRLSSRRETSHSSRPTPLVPRRDDATITLSFLSRGTDEARALPDDKSRQIIPDVLVDGAHLADGGTHFGIYRGLFT